MITQNKVLTTFLSIASLISAGQAFADEEMTVPRGPEIHGIASHCAIGDVPQTSKAGPYNKYCTVLKDAEKCLALIKSRMDRQGNIEELMKGDEDERRKSEICVETFRVQLLKVRE